MGTYYRFMVFNVISFSFLAGNIVILYAVRMGAPNGLVGLIAASYQLTFIFTLIGRRLVHRFGAVRLFGYFWALRYLFMIPVIFTVLPVFAGRTPLVLTIVALGALGFNTSKGIGLTAMRPVVGELPRPRERGAFLSNVQMIAQIVGIGAGLTMAFVLGEDEGLWRYSVLIGVGLLSGLVAARFVLKLPEPQEAVRGFSGNFAEGLRSSLRDVTFHRLTLINAVIVFALSLAAAFLIVYFRRVYGFADGTIVFFTVAGNIGAAIMAAISRSVLDRVGPKPLLFVMSLLIVATFVPLIISPNIDGVWRYLFPALIYFFLVMGQMGALNTSDAFFFSITDAKHRIDRGIVFGVSSGLAGTAGGLIGGILLSGLEVALPTLQGAFGVFFGVAALLVFAAAIAVTRLPDAKSLRMQDALGALVSPRDIRAIRLLNRLTRSRTVDEEQAAVEALRESSSRLPAEELIRRVGSPSLAVRMEAIGALRNTPLDKDAVSVLIDEVRRHPYTTAHIAAEILGNAGAVVALPTLREAIRSTDYMLRSKSMVALATLGDTQSIPAIEDELRRTENPRVTVYAVRALELLSSVRSLPSIIDRLTDQTEPPVRDQLVLSIAGLLDIQDRFYPLFVEYLEDPDSAVHQLEEEAGADTELRRLVASVHSVEAFVPEAATRLRQAAISVDGVDAGAILADALAGKPAAQLDRFRFLCATLMCEHHGGGVGITVL